MQVSEFQFIKWLGRKIEKIFKKRCIALVTVVHNIINKLVMYIVILDCNLCEHF